MKGNIVFYFSGTGNCVQVAKTIAADMPNCEIVSMGRSKDYDLKNEYESIGFIYPVYFQGLPLVVDEFVSRLNLQNNKKAYYYTIATYGELAGTAVAQLNRLLRNKNLILHYGTKLKMFSNYVVMYDMSGKIREKTEQSKKDLVGIIEDIQNKNIKKVKRVNPILDFYYHLWAKRIPRMDKNFNVSEACISCGICQKVCSVQNINLSAGKLEFSHHCEQCLACLQFCPEKAINYKERTRKRGRYTHPDIGYKDMI